MNSEAVERRRSQPSWVLRGWGIVAQALFAGAFAQSVFAGVLLSGEDWGRTAHGFTALGLVASAYLASLAAAVSAREAPGGLRLAALFFGLAVVLTAQMAVGRMSAEGENLMWLHIPLGVAMVGFAAQLAGVARRVG